VKTLDKELIKSLSDLLDEKLTPIKNDIKNIKSDLSGVKSDLSGVKSDLSNVKSDLSNVKSDLKSIKSQQEESISILRALEHKADINKAEHDKLFNDIANLTGSVENMRKDLSAVEVVTARNMENIAQLKLVK